MNKLDYMLQDILDRSTSPLEMLREIVSYEPTKKEQRSAAVSLFLEALGIDYEKQKYESGENIIVCIGKPPFIGIGSHYDVVPNSPGANDNASAMAVTIDVLRRVKENNLRIGVRGFFFDEEETGLKGSRAYVQKYGIEDLMGVYNMELVGTGDNLAFWVENKLHDGVLLRKIEHCATRRGVQTYRFPSIRRLLENSGDQESFIEAGMEEAFCITAISNKDVELARKYNLLDKIGNSPPSLEDLDIFHHADLFRHYHRQSDTHEHISERTLQMVADVLWDAIKEIDKVNENKNLTRRKDKV